MPLFCVTWKLFDDKKSDAYTYLAATTPEQYAKDLGPLVKPHGRWHHLGNGTGLAIYEAATADAVHQYVWSWAEHMCEVLVTPCIDHNELREVFNGKPSEWTFSNDNSRDEPREGESLYWATYECNAGCIVPVYERACSMTLEDDVEAQGKAGVVRHLGRWHMPNIGMGHFICATTDPKELYAWSNKWSSMAKVTFTSVLTDQAVTKVIQQKPGYEKKLSDLMAKMNVA